MLPMTFIVASLIMRGYQNLRIYPYHAFIHESTIMAFNAIKEIEKESRTL